MANLTSARDTERMVSPWDAKFSLPIAASQTIFQGGLVGINAAGKVVRGGGVASGFAGALLGRACASVDSPAVDSEYEFEQGVFCFTNNGLTAADVNGLVFADDDNTVSATDTNVIAGLLVRVDSAGAWVKVGFFGFALDAVE